MLVCIVRDYQLNNLRCILPRPIDCCHGSSVAFHLNTPSLAEACAGLSGSGKIDGTKLVHGRDTEDLCSSSCPASVFFPPEAS